MGSSTPIGVHLRLWRKRRRLSQLELSLRAEVSARHLSFVETGRAQPGRELILRLSEELEIPRRERNALLAGAGFAPVFQQRSLADASFDSVRAIIDVALETHRPFPAYVIDRHWNVIASNAAVPEIYEGVAPELLGPPLNVIRMMLHPRGLAPRIVNISAWWTHLLTQLRRQVDLTADPTLERLLREAASYPGPGVDERTHASAEAVAMPLEIATSIGHLSFLSATTVFGTPLDVTLEEIALELLYPADSLTEQVIRQSAGAQPRPEPVRV